MTEHKLSLHLKAFNDKVKIMNQTNGREVVLNAVEARNLHNDIFALLSQIAELTQRKDQLEADAEIINIQFNGGNFN